MNKELALVILYHAAPNSSNIKINKDEISDYAWASLKEIKNDKYPLRAPMLKKILIRSLTEKPLPINTLQIYP